MWTNNRTPRSNDLINLEDAPVETPARIDPVAQEQQDMDESDDDEADYIPAGLASFVRQAETTLRSTRNTFLSDASKADPAVFCFDGSGNGRSTPPLLEDADDVNLRNEVLDKFNCEPLCEEQPSDVEELVLSRYEKEEEVLFSPDLKTPPPNPHYNVSGTEARKLALETTTLSVDTDILPIKPPSHEEQSRSSNSVDEEPVESMDPSTWLSTAKPDPPSEHIAKSESHVASQIMQSTSSSSYPVVDNVIHLEDVEEPDHFSPKGMTKASHPAIARSSAEKVPEKGAEKTPPKSKPPTEILLGEPLDDSKPKSTPFQSGGQGKGPIKRAQQSHPIPEINAKAKMKKTVASPAQASTRVTKTYKQSPETPGSGNIGEQKTSPVLTTPSKPSGRGGVPSRLFQETTASKLRHARVEEKESTDPVVSPMTASPELSPTSRLLHGTSSSKFRRAARESPPAEKSVRSPARTNHANVPSRLLQGTSSFQQKLAARAQKNMPKSTPSQIQKTNSAELLASRERAQERVRQHLAKEKSKLNTDRGQAKGKLSAEEAMARAKERVRLHKLKMKEKDLATNKEGTRRQSTATRSSVGHPDHSTAGSPSSQARRPPTSYTSYTTPAQSTDTFRRVLRSDDMSVSSNTSKYRALTVPHSPTFSTSREHGEKQSSLRWNQTSTPASSSRFLQNQLRGDDPSLRKRRVAKLTVPEAPKFSKPTRQSLPKSTIDMSSTRLLQTQLRAEDASLRERRERKLTIPKAPKFSKPYKPPPRKSNTDMSSTRLLQTQLRADDASLRKRRSGKVTLPQSPKLHKSTKHNLPKSTAELEIELMEGIKSQPFRAKPYRPSTARSSQVARKRPSRQPATVPKPFHFSSNSHTRSGHKEPLLQTESDDDIELKKQFHARPMPSFRRPSTQYGKTTEQDVSPRTRAYLLAEAKRRQREKHEEEMRKASTRKSPESIAATRALERPFHLESLKRHEEYQKKIDEKRRRAREEEEKVKTFRAREFRGPPAPPEPRRQSHARTTPEPFPLQSLQRHTQRQQQIRRELEENEQKEQEQAQFRARPIPISTYKPNSPTGQPILSATTARLRALEEEKKKREEAELAELRKMQFKARPLPATTYEYTGSGSPSGRAANMNLETGDLPHAGGNSPYEQKFHGTEHGGLHHGGNQEQSFRSDQHSSPPVKSIFF